MQTVETLKEQGNNAFKAQKYLQALELYSQALLLDPQNYILYSNRSAVQIQLKNYELALSDADKVKQIQAFSCAQLCSPYNVVQVYCETPIFKMHESYRGAKFCFNT